MVGSPLQCSSPRQKDKKEEKSFTACMGTFSCGHSPPTLTRGNRKVVDFIRSHVKNNSKLTNLMKLTRIEGYNGK